MILTVSSHFVKNLCCGVLIKRVVILFQLLLQEGKVLDDGGTVALVAVSHASHLCGILGCLRLLDLVVRLDDRVLADAYKLSVARV